MVVNATFLLLLGVFPVLPSKDLSKIPSLFKIPLFSKIKDNFKI